MGVLIIIARDETELQKKLLAHWTEQDWLDQPDAELHARWIGEPPRRRAYVVVPEFPKED